MTEFGKLDPDGSYEHIRTLPQDAMLACPNFIMVPEHYRKDNSCRCQDPNHWEMAEWGYEWKDGQWR